MGSLRRRLTRLERVEHPGLTHGYGVPNEEIERQWEQFIAEEIERTGQSREEVEAALLADEAIRALREEL